MKTAATPRTKSLQCFRGGPASESRDKSSVSSNSWASLEAIARSEASKHPRETPEGLRHYFESFSFTFTDEEQEALTEFLRYAFYHVVLPDVAELNFYKTGDEDDIPLFGLSLN